MLLEMRLSVEPDLILGTFRMTPENQLAIADGRTVELSDGSGGTAQLSMLSRFPLSEPDRNAIYKFSNPWGLTFTPDGLGLYMADASQNSVTRVDLATGKWQRLMRFAPVPNPTPVGAPVLDAVPTSVRTYGDQLLVSLLTGFPFVPGNSRVMLVDPVTGTSQQFMFDLTSVTDVLWRPRPNARPQFFVLEFSANQSATPAPPGRLLRFDTENATVAAAPLITPVSLAFDEATQDLFILELRGQILRLHIE
ncbi:MAG: ScyD/ScyE family protein [Bryobacterales bacterium]|nr:ScyD/ScyE family protein [Bryobacterales bacterium]